MTDLGEMAKGILDAARARESAKPSPAEEREQRRQAFMARRRAKRALLAPRIKKTMLDKLRVVETPSAVLLGRTGIGKTSAAHWLLAGRQYVLIDAQDLARAEKAWPLGKGEPPEVVAARQAKLLVVDDVGSEVDPAALQTVLRHRYEKGKPVIVTSGLTPAELRQWVGAAYIRRMVEQFTGPAVFYWNDWDE